MKVIIIDGQIWQTGAWHRGMGAYVLGLFGAFLKQDNGIKIVVMLNQNIPTDDERLDAIKGELPGIELYQLDLPIDPEEKDNQHAVKTIDHFIAEQFANDEVYYLIASPFLFGYSAVFPTNAKKLMFFYDFIPLRYWRVLGKFFPPHLYFNRFNLLYQADMVFTDSQNAADDAMAFLGIEERRLQNLDGSINEQARFDKNDPAATAVLDRLDIRTTPFILMPTGGLPHKNNVRAVEAFARIQKTSGARCKLVATSNFSPAEKEELLQISEGVVFSDIISAQDLAVLFAHCSVLFFPTLYEGLGIPVLEGATNGKPVACSDIPVFREIPKYREALYIFDPLDVSSMAEQLFRALAKADFDQKRTHYPEILAKYSWPRSARVLADSIAAFDFPESAAPTTKIAVICPDPRKNNKVATFAQRMYGFGLQHGIEFTYFLDSGKPDGVGEAFLPDYIRCIAPSYDIGDLYYQLEQQSFAQVLHFVSNDSQFVRTLRAALTVPGYIYIADDDFGALFAALSDKQYCSPDQAAAEARLLELERQQQLLPAGSLLGLARGVIVERPVADIVQRTVKQLKLSIPVLATPVSEDIIAADDAWRGQDRAYEALFTFLQKEHEE